MPVPRCAALRRDGRECGALASSPTATYCRHHEQLASELGDDAVRTGRYPRRRNPRLEAPVSIEETTTTAITSGAITPAEVGRCLHRRRRRRWMRSRPRCSTPPLVRRARTGRRSPAPSAARSIGLKCWFPMCERGSARSRCYFARASAGRRRTHLADSSWQPCLDSRRREDRRVVRQRRDDWRE